MWWFLAAVDLWWPQADDGIFGDGSEDMDWVLASKGIFARSVGVGFMLRHDQGGEQSILVVGFID